MTLVSEQGFEITDPPGTNRPMSRKAKKRAAAKARREAAAATRAEAEAEAAEETEVEVVVEVEAETEVEVDVEVDADVEVEVEAQQDLDEVIADATDAEQDEEPDSEVVDTQAEETASLEETANLEEPADVAVESEAVSEQITEPEPEFVDEESELAESLPNDPIADEQVEVEVPATPPFLAPAVTRDRQGTNDIWTGQQLAAVAQRVIAIFVVLGLVGYGLGFARGGGSTARAEFVYTLDESVPDSFLREDRRLLTQVVTFESDAVLTPVADEFDLTVDELRSKIEVDTLNLSEVLRLDVQDADPERAVALNQAVLDQYLRVIADASPAGDGEELADRREAVSAELELADAARLDLLKSQEQDVPLQLQQENLQQRISAKIEQVGALQQDLDAAIIGRVGAAQQATVANTLAAAEADLADLEDQLLEVGAKRAELATATTTEPALLREVERLEAKLTTIDNELAERELAPLVASPIRELSEPIVLSVSRHLGGLQGLALGLFLAMPFGALVALRARKRQLWFD